MIAMLIYLKWLWFVFLLEISRGHLGRDRGLLMRAIFNQQCKPFLKKALRGEAGISFGRLSE